MTAQATALHRNPFHVLGASVRDDRHRIIALAEDRLLELEHEDCAKARSDLLSPRARLGAEVAWLPGVSPRRASQLAEQVMRDPLAARRETGLPTLAQANLLAATLEVAGPQPTARELAQWIVETATVAGRIATADVVRDINEDRAVARFAPIASEAPIEQELAERARYYRSVLRGALDRLEPRQLVAAISAAVDVATKGGTEPAPPLIDGLVELYEVDAQQFLHDEGERVTALVAALRDAAPHGEEIVAPLVGRLTAVVRNWDAVAQPIQLSGRARGTQHRRSKDIGLAIRSLAVDLFNEHDMLEQAKRITQLLRELFSELPELAERLAEDAKALGNIEAARADARARAERERAELAREITYSAEIGLLFKDVLSIGPEGASWRGKRFPLDTISRLRWGATRHSVNGIPTGTTYTIAFGDAHTEAVVECRREEVFAAFVERLWKGVGVRLLIEQLQELGAGKEWSVGGVRVRDDGITLVRHNFWTSEPAVRPWSAIRTWSANGALNIGATDDKKVYVAIPYIETVNAHVLAHALQMALRQPGLRRLSELLKQR